MYLFNIIADPAISQLIDAGLVLYLGLVVLFVWRFFCAWKCCGTWLQYANYCSLLLALVFIILVYDSYYFFQVAMTDQGKSTWDTMPSWLRPWILAAPVICLATYLASAFQTFQHVERIHEESAVQRHDRAVQIILLPAIYSVMGFSAMTRMYTYLGSESSPYSDGNEEMLHRSLSRSETCFWVGDLYEAWALFQFGKLTLEVIQSNILAQAKFGDEQERAAARALHGSHSAVESLVWLGILSFLLVCVAEAGWSLWLLTFETSMSSTDFDRSMSQFTIAGFLASCAAIYNVFIVEESYHAYLVSYYPRLKFITVKVLVTFAWVQKGFLKILMNVVTIMPEKMANWFYKVPLVGQFLKFSPAVFEMFYAALIITECFVVCVAHYWAWNSGEEWYDEAAADEAAQERSNDQSLMGTADKSSYGAA